MNDANTLSKKQLAVIDDLFAGTLSEQQILTKNGVSKNLYRKWLADAEFVSEFKNRLDWLNMQSQANIARHSGHAAAKLISLVDSDKEETARKACLDILSLVRANSQKTDNKAHKTDFQPATSHHSSELPPETASKLLQVLANN